jgi:hypothetical protein
MPTPPHSLFYVPATCTLDHVKLHFSDLPVVITPGLDKAFVISYPEYMLQTVADIVDSLGGTLLKYRLDTHQEKPAPETPKKRIQHIVGECRFLRAMSSTAWW